MPNVWLLVGGVLLLLALVRDGVEGSGSGGGYRYASQIGKVGSCDGLSRYRALYVAAGDRYGVPWRLLAAQGCEESGYRSDAISYVGASGIAQLMPDTARDWGLRVVTTDYRGRAFPATVNPRLDERFAPELAIDVQARIMSRNYEDFGDWTAALAAYRSGRRAVETRGPSDGDRSYAARILARAPTL